MKNNIINSCFLSIALMLMSATAFTLAGCEEKEKVLDIETPGGELEIERDKSDGNIGVDLKKKE
ncbi:MAG: hypothetical protein KDA70_02375 [Planctomycetaceae bacterium]|nr:hypothetical protein [Planctomycetaceae bacterium]MCA9022920.1 hypothetical protein [Planctomycetaceae bacterium]